MKYSIFFVLFVLICAMRPLKAQVISFPYAESFDGVTAPALPTGWSVNGFIMNTSTFRSSPNCVSTTGNTVTKSITSPIFDFTERIPDRLVFWERRSGTAAAYRFEVRASLDGTDFSILLAHYDTITSTSGYVQRIVNLEGSGLQRQPNVRFQWQLLGDNTNTTGVLRIDDISLTVSTGLDIGMTSMVVSPANATRKDTLTLSVCVKNYGSLAVSGFPVQFFSDNNLNGIAESGEQFSAVGGLSLSPGDSLICETTHPPIKAGEHCFIAVIGFSQDENKANDTLHLIVNIQCMKGDLLINEIMYAPTGDEPEWVEFYNSAPDSINLKNWRISDSNISTKSAISTTDIFMVPNSYLIVVKDLSFSTIHPGVFSVIANFSALNNTTPDAVVLYDAASYSIDSVMYQPKWGGQNGKSLERIDVYTSSISAANWGTSQDSLGFTPGKINSIARLDYDLAISNLTQTRIVSDGKMVPVINVTVQNIGRQIIDSVIVHFYADRNRSMYPDTSELLQSVVSPQRIFAGDSVQISESLPQLAAGEMSVVVVAENWSDERLRNNQASVTIKIGYELRSLIINEIMYDPLDDQNEWLELYNRSSQPVDLAHWTFNDRATSSGVNSFVISNQSSIVRSGEFVIIAADSSLFTLFPNIIQADSIIHIVILNHSSGFSFNNDGDAIVLKDLTGQTIDSVAYLPCWHHPDVVDTRGRSLERINPNIDTNDPRNWSTCTNVVGGTPGKINSVMTTSAVSNSAISISPNPFSPDGDGFEDYCMIHYNLPMPASMLNVRIYDIKGRCIRTLANCEFAGAKGEIIWDGFDESRQRARIGVYVVYLEATDRSSGRVERAKVVAVVATKL
ncbi:MAG: lamin tail domain-containing protein [Bacteroidota bacterium]